MTSVNTTNVAWDYGIAPPAYRLPAATRLGAVHLQVADLERSLEYYGRVLGMSVLHKSTASAALGAQGDRRPIIELHEKKGVTAVPRRGRIGLYHFAILLPDRAALGRFLQHIADIREYAGMSDHLVSEAIYLTDPDGLGIEVYADRPRSSWRHDARQLSMATEPLNVAEVLQAGGNEAWSGMPAGTVLGHVHLFVSDLEAAESFYHAGLGFDKIVWSYPGALFLSAGGYHHHLGTNTWAAGAPVATDADARLLEWTIEVPRMEDAEAAARNVEKAGNKASREGSDWLVTDPWGTRIRLHPSRG
jgi:catechol 2,3-dioxygenase